MLNLWSVVFIAGIAQGLFLIGLFFTVNWKNPLAARILTAIILLAVVTDLDYLSVTSGWYLTGPWIFGVSFGSMFLFGPLLNWYGRSLLTRDFRFSRSLLLHLGPFLLYKLMLLPLYSLTAEVKLSFIDAFARGILPLRPMELVVFIVQCIHMATYIAITIPLLRSEEGTQSGLLVPVESRRGWIRIILACFICFLIAIVVLVVYVAYCGVYSPLANYLFAAWLSLTIFVIGYTFAVRRDVVAPDYAGKYSSPPIPDQARQELSEKLRILMENENVYLDPDLTLGNLAARVGTTPHTLSRLINESGEEGKKKNFFDFVNSYRIAEIRRRLTDPRYQALSILGIAMECGFNSKSSFNTAFRKHTGMTPTEYKSSQEAAV